MCCIRAVSLLHCHHVNDILAHHPNGSLMLMASVVWAAWLGNRNQCLGWESYNIIDRTGLEKLGFGQHQHRIFLSCLTVGHHHVGVARFSDWRTEGEEGFQEHVHSLYPENKISYFKQWQYSNSIQFKRKFVIITPEWSKDTAATPSSNIIINQCSFCLAH